MATPPTDADLRQRWRRCLWITALLMSVGFVVTFAVSFLARSLSFNLFGWPFSFWMASQGALLVYLALVCIYARAMQRLDMRYGVAEDD